MKLKELKIFDYATSTYDEFADELENNIISMMTEKKYHVISKSLILASMGFINIYNWRFALTANNVLDSEKKLWLLNYTFASQEQNMLDYINNPDTDQSIRISLDRQMNLFYGRMYDTERHSNDEAKVDEFKEKFILKLESKGVLNE